MIVSFTVEGHSSVSQQAAIGNAFASISGNLAEGYNLQISIVSLLKNPAGQWSATLSIEFETPDDEEDGKDIKLEEEKSLSQNGGDKKQEREREEDLIAELQRKEEDKKIDDKKKLLEEKRRAAELDEDNSHRMDLHAYETYYPLRHSGFDQLQLAQLIIHPDIDFTAATQSSLGIESGPAWHGSHNIFLANEPKPA